MRSSNAHARSQLYLKLPDSAYSNLLITPGLVVGETENGELLLDSRNPDYQFIRFEALEDGWAIRCLRDGFIFQNSHAKETRPSDVFRLTEDLGIQFPTCTLITTEDPLSAPPKRKIRFVPIIEEHDTYESQASTPTLSKALDKGRREGHGPTREPCRHRTRSIAASVLLPILCLAPLYNFIEFEVPGIQTRGAGGTSIPLDHTPHLQTLPRALDETILQPLKPPTGPQPEWPVMLPTPTYLARIPEYIAVSREAMEVAALIDSGQLLWPENSTIKSLSALLERFPDHPAVTRLHARATNMLVYVAENMFENGYRQDAGFLLNKALPMAPRDTRALELEKNMSLANRRHQATRLFTAPSTHLQ